MGFPSFVWVPVIFVISISIRFHVVGLQFLKVMCVCSSSGNLDQNLGMMYFYLDKVAMLIRLLCERLLMDCTKFLCSL